MKPRRDWIPPTIDDIVGFPVTRGQIVLFACWFIVAGVIVSGLVVDVPTRGVRDVFLPILGAMALLFASGAAGWRYWRWRIVIEGNDADGRVTERTQEFSSNGVLTRLRISFDTLDGTVVSSRLTHPVVWRSVQVGETVWIRYLASNAHRWVAVGDCVKPPYPPQWRHLVRLGLVLTVMELVLGALYVVPLL
jgi:hypothetical protein